MSLKADVSNVSPSAFALRRANARNVSFFILYGGQFASSTQLIVLDYPVILFHQCCSTVSLETYPPLFIEKNSRLLLNEVIALSCVENNSTLSISPVVL